MKRTPTIVLALTVSCAKPASPDVAPVLEPQSDVTLPLSAPPPEPSFPTFEPFQSMARFPSEVEEGLREELAALRDMAAEGAELPDPWLASGPCALTTSMTLEQRLVSLRVPSVLQILEPLWRSDRWSADQVERACSVARFLVPLADAPQLQFALEDDQRNRAGLVAIASWFRRRVETPDGYAAMLEQHSGDYGPFVGLPCDPLEPSTAQGACKVDDRIEFRLYHVNRETDPWVFQVVKDGTPQWTRAACPADSYTEVAFLDYSPDSVHNLGTYGWRVTLRWDGEGCAVYLDPHGQLLFYFVGF